MDGWTGIWFALLLLILPARWIGAFGLAVLIHEICHMLAVKLLGGRILNLRISPAGITMAVSDMAPGREWLCTMAGPVGSITLMFFLPLFPELALCGLAHGLFNLLPVYPLDGGRCLKCLIALFLPEDMKNRFFQIVQTILILFLSLTGMYLTFCLKWGILPLLFSFRLAYAGFQEIPLALRPFRRYNRTTIDKEVML